MNRFLIPLLLTNVAFAQNDPLKEVSSLNWGLHNKDGYSINIPKSIYKRSRKKIKIAVIDTGVDCSYRSLKCSKLGWDFSNNTKDGAYTDNNGHGTHISGIIASVNPDVEIIPIKYYLDSESGSKNLKATVRAIRYAINAKVNIINYSGGGSDSSSEELQALREAESKGILVIAAAGNEGSNTEIKKFYPAAYGLPNIISVAGLNRDGNLFVMSNYGIDVDIGAPGENIKSLAPNNSTRYMSGTSQATAFVTGVASLLMSINPTLDYSEIKRQICENAEVTTNTKGKTKCGQLSLKKLKLPSR